ncbi:hypothetical protein BHM03_00034610 [Ensete ventricosum]|nr:hypothetical protein BHM03_00034610 [Ensete ventricosum]
MSPTNGQSPSPLRRQHHCVTSDRPTLKQSPLAACNLPVGTAFVAKRICHPFAGIFRRSKNTKKGGWLRRDEKEENRRGRPKMQSITCDGCPYLLFIDRL